jgi:hydroxymethylbilane synthase
MTERKSFVIGSRQSLLALKQTEVVLEELQKIYPEYKFTIESIQTLGDKIQSIPLHDIGAKSLWTKDLETLLLAKHCDLIVHSLKDMPTALSDDCTIGAILSRHDPRDAMVLKKDSVYKSLDDLDKGSIVGTSSVRRSAQLKRAYPHLRFADVRGNIGTRLSKLDAPDSKYACLVLAVAGLQRLKMEDRISQYLGSPQVLYAVGQGALGVEIRSKDTVVMEMLKPLNHRPTQLACLAERMLLRCLEGGCSVPIGVESEFSGSLLKLSGVVVSVDGECIAKARDELIVENEAMAEKLGRQVAQLLLDDGADVILDKINGQRKEREVLENTLVIN